MIAKNGYVMRKNNNMNLGIYWHRIKHKQKARTGMINIGTISFPQEWIGKKVKLKIEEVKE